MSSADAFRPPSQRLPRRARFVPLQQTIAGRYKVHASLGSGGMGTVCSAIDLQTGVEVAIKFLNMTSLTTEGLRRFRREAETATSVRNRHVCEVHYLGVEQGMPFIVMERLVGETLRRRIADTGPVSPADAVAVMMQVLEGLSAAHAVGVIHRDIKPANVFVTTPRGAPPRAKIIDFGLAKLVGLGPARARCAPSCTEELTSITTTDVIPGTPTYLSPEQVAGVRELDLRVDIWAAGLTLYEILLGRRAFVASSNIGLARTILFESVPPISSLRADLPVGFDSVLGKALRKDRDERYASADEFRAALIDVWARHRTIGVSRGERMRRFRPEAKTLPDDEAPEDPTELHIAVDFEP